jgi:hypothetical protein
MRFFKPSRFKIVLFVLLLFPIFTILSYGLTNCESQARYINNKIVDVELPCGNISYIANSSVLFIILLIVLSYLIPVVISKIIEKKDSRIKKSIIITVIIINLLLFLAIVRFFLVAMSTPPLN